MLLAAARSGLTLKAALWQAGELAFRAVKCSMLQVMTDWVGRLLRSWADAARQRCRPHCALQQRDMLKCAQDERKAQQCRIHTTRHVHSQPAQGTAGPCSEPCLLLVKACNLAVHKMGMHGSPDSTWRHIFVLQLLGTTIKCVRLWLLSLLRLTELKCTSHLHATRQHPFVAGAQRMERGPVHTTALVGVVGSSRVALLRSGCVTLERSRD